MLLAEDLAARTAAEDGPDRADDVVAAPLAQADLEADEHAAGGRNVGELRVGHRRQGFLSSGTVTALTTVGCCCRDCTYFDEPGDATLLRPGLLHLDGRLRRRGLVLLRIEPQQARVLLQALFHAGVRQAGEVGDRLLVPLQRPGAHRFLLVAFEFLRQFPPAVGQDEAIVRGFRVVAIFLRGRFQVPVASAGEHRQPLVPVALAQAVILAQGRVGLAVLGILFDRRERVLEGLVGRAGIVGSLSPAAEAV